MSSLPCIPRGPGRYEGGSCLTSIIENAVTSLSAAEVDLSRPDGSYEALVPNNAAPVVLIPDTDKDGIPSAVPADLPDGWFWGVLRPDGYIDMPDALGMGTDTLCPACVKTLQTAAGFHFHQSSNGFVTVSAIETAAEYEEAKRKGEEASEEDGEGY